MGWKHMGWKYVATALIGALLLAGTGASDVNAQPRGRGDVRGGIDRDWVLLGQKLVSFRVDRDVINIGQSEDWYRSRAFGSLHFVAERNDIHLLSVRVVYFNGYGETLDTDRLIPRGGQLVLDLRGERSYLRQIEMTYRSRPNFRGEALIKVYGEPARRGPPGPPPVAGGRDWVELGCQQVALLGKDRDTIPVGRREGRFKAIRLLVRGADVEIRDLKVIYANGQPDDLLVRSTIREGERTRPLDLKGWERAIQQINMTYRTKLNPLRMIAKQRITTATVCVEGLQ
jgi:hypothetical protein